MDRKFSNLPAIITTCQGGRPSILCARYSWQLDSEFCFTHKDFFTSWGMGLIGNLGEISIAKI